MSDAWPVKYTPSSLKATGNEVLIESLELANEGIERVA
ncbi:MAG: phage tail protein [Acidobacteriaceae bacterium]